MVSTTTRSQDEGAVGVVDPEEAGREEEHVHGSAAEEVPGKGGDIKPAEGGRQAAVDAGEVEVVEVASSEDEQGQADQKRGFGDQAAVGYLCLVCGEANSDQRPLFKCSTLHCGGLVHLKCIKNLECFRESSYTPADGVSMEDAILTKDDVHTCFCCFWVEGIPPSMRKRTSLGVAPDAQSCSECNKEMKYDAMGRDVELLKCPLPSCPGVFHYACVAKHGRISSGRCDPSIVVRCSDGCAAVDASHIGSQFEICGGSQRVKAQVERARRSAAAAVSTRAKHSDAAWTGAAELEEGTEEGKEESDLLATEEDDAGGGGYQDPDEGDLKPAAVSDRKRRARSCNAAVQKPSKTRKTVSVLKKAASNLSAHEEDDASCGGDEEEEGDGGLADGEDEEDEKKHHFPYKTKARSDTRKRIFTSPCDDDNNSSSSSIASSNRGSKKKPACKAVAPSKLAVRVEDGKLFGWKEAVSLVRADRGRVEQEHAGFAVYFEDRRLAEQVLQLGGVVLPVVIHDDEDD